ncbi:histidinol-phosphate transaminase [[Eubacterium] cellulosolvens]
MLNSQRIKNIIGLLEPYDPGFFPDDVIKKYGIHNEQIINLSSNENPNIFPKELREQLAEDLINVNRYPNPSYKDLKKTISEYVRLPIECIAVGNGSSDLIELACKILLNPLDKVVMPVPTYTLYVLESMIWETGITYVETEKSGFIIKAENLKPYLNDAKLVFLGSPNNPTGLSVSKKELEEMLKAEKVTFIVDEAYSEFSDKTAADLIKKYDNLIVMRSMSKYFCLAGLRIGYSLSNSTIAESLEKVRLPFTISRIASTAAILALKNSKYFHVMAKELLLERNRLSVELKKIGLKPYPSDANFLMVKLPKGMDSNKFSEILARQGVIVRSLKRLLGLSNGEYLRISIGTKKENEQFIETCKNLLHN